MSGPDPVAPGTAAAPAATQAAARSADREDRARLGREPRGPEAAAPRRRLFRRGPWENAATVLIILGIAMLMQPVSLTLYAYSFVTILAGTVGFIVFSHFPE